MGEERARGIEAGWLGGYIVIIIVLKASGIAIKVSLPQTEDGFLIISTLHYLSLVRVFQILVFEQLRGQLSSKTDDESQSVIPSSSSDSPPPCYSYVSLWSSEAGRQKPPSTDTP